MSKKFYIKQLSLAYVHSLVLFNPEIGPYQVLPLWARVELGVMAMKEHSAFPKAVKYFTAPANWEIHDSNFQTLF